MGISSHEMYLILKVRDEASRALRAFGGEFSRLSGTQLAAAQKQIAAGAALATVGVAIGAAGIAGLAFFNDAIDASMEYTQAAARTLTQVDKLGVSLQDIADMGRRIANEVPIAFEEIQAGLYDIFSSMDVTMPQAEKLLKALSKAAVAGTVDVSTAARATIGILNAYKLPAREVNKVNDVMFQLVRKGIGTYKDFTATIGRSIPSAVKAGQSYQQVAGMLAFLTRNNMSAAMSASAAARAMDAITKTKAIAHLKKMGIAVADAKGNFRPMVDIMTELRVKLQKLTPAARAAKLDEIFKGSGGTIQAMRFFNLATGKAGGLLNTMTTAMHKAGGAADQAYAVMSNTPQAKLQQLSNRYQSMKTIVGEQLLPVKLQLAEALGKLLAWWNKLSPKTQEMIVKFAAIASVVLVVLGVVIAIVGGFLMLAGAAALAGVAMATVGIIIAAVVAGILVFGVVVFLLIKYHTQIKTFIINTWNTIKNWLSATWDTIKAKAISVFNAVKNWLSTTWDTIKNKVVSIWNAIAGFFISVWNKIAGIVSAGIAWVRGVIDAGMAFIQRIWKAYWELMGPVLKAFWNVIVAIVRFGIQLVKFIIAWTMRGILIAWNFVWGLIKQYVIKTWTNIYNYIATKLTAARNFISAGWNAVKTITTTVWNIIYTYISGKLSAVANFISGKLATIKSWISTGWNAVKNITLAAWSVFSSLIRDRIDSAMNFVRAIKNRVLGHLSGARTWLYNAGSSIMRGLADGIEAGFKWVADKINAATKWIADHMPGSPVKQGALRVLNNGYAGKQIVKMLAGGMSNLGPITKAMDTMGRVMVTPTMAPAEIGGFVNYGPRRPPGPDGGAGPGQGPGSAGAGQTIHMKNYITTQEINPEKHAADLGWAFASKVRP